MLKTLDVSTSNNSYTDKKNNIIIFGLSANFGHIIFIYFLLQIILRVAIGNSLGTDEAEQIITAQSFEWGYGSQPPLYTWLVIGVFQLFGPTLFSLALLKNALLCLGYFGIWSAAKKIGPPRFAVLCTLSVFFLPQISWEAQRALTHSVLLFTCASWTIYGFISLQEKPDLLKSIGFGLLIAAGLISKFNYLFVFAALIFALSCHAQGRAYLFSKYFFISIGVAALLLTQPMLWNINHLDLAASRVNKFGMEAGWQTAFQGLWAFVTASFNFCAVVFALYLPVLFKPLQNSSIARQNVNKAHLDYLKTALFIGLVIVAITIVASGTTNVKDRWLQPLLLLVPIVIVGHFWAKLHDRHIKYLYVSVVICAIAIIIFLPLALTHGTFKKPSIQRFPSQIIALQLKQEGIKTVITNSNALAGQLAFHNSELTVVTLEYSVLDVPHSKPLAIIWTGPQTAQVPPNIAQLYQRLYNEPLRPQQKPTHNILPLTQTLASRISQQPIIPFPYNQLIIEN
ncbi:ArnT family glycosyltransferase [Polycladidibacter stylochi]|uniref:ArnT family glycosyltransferase n=1 Tax=Polycladidibacter stylochi TaxID=1807766 RepID=UPI000836C15B|nr:glycosyltransferase family 39 protein [Pseudovibrio stylochi]